ncbi:MAG: TetR/AcrR family transcriptional regulator, partial [Chitinivibrionales bacterium]
LSVQDYLERKKVAETSTKERIINTASFLFAEKGYRDATNADICSASDVNIAAINYHFGSKAELYRVVYQELVERASKIYPLDSGLAWNASAEDRLKAFVRAVVNRLNDSGAIGCLHRIHMSEFFDSTGILDDLISEFIEKENKYMKASIKEVLGDDSKDKDVTLSAMSILSQCIFITSEKIGDFIEPDSDEEMSISIEDISDHIINMTMYGIKRG